MHRLRQHFADFLQNWTSNSKLLILVFYWNLRYIINIARSVCCTEISFISHANLNSFPIDVFISIGHGGSRAAEFLKQHLFENLMKHPEFKDNTKLAISELTIVILTCCTRYFFLFDNVSSVPCSILVMLQDSVGCVILWWMRVLRILASHISFVHGCGMHPHFPSAIYFCIFFFLLWVWLKRNDHVLLYNWRLIRYNGISGNTYQQTDSDFLESEKDTFRDDGSTASTAVLVGNHLYVANVGDSRTIISKAGKGKLSLHDSQSLLLLRLLPTDGGNIWI